MGFGAGIPARPRAARASDALGLVSVEFPADGRVASYGVLREEPTRPEPERLSPTERPPPGGVSARTPQASSVPRPRRTG
ncbi:hypothetical protein GCM10027160_29710 [Streptomyces calidiresistens]